MSIELPFPPSVNRLWRSYQGRMLLSRAGRAYRAEAGLALGLCQSFGRQPVRVHVEAFMPDARRRDLDNLWKAAGDALQANRIVADDSQIRDLRIVHCGIDRARPRLVVTMEAM